MIDSKNFPGRGQVAILRTRPETVLDDYYRLLHLAGYESNLPKAQDTILKLNLSWQIWYPGCSTTPWQLDGVVRALLRDSYPRERILTATANPPGVDAQQGAVNNRLQLVENHYGIHPLQPNPADAQWVRYEPKTPLAVLDQLYPDGIYLPQAYYGKNVVHLPTMKTDALTNLTGAMTNALDGYLDQKHRLTNAALHDALVDLLQIQQDTQSGIFCVTDGTFAGEGPGPRAMRPYVKNTILASADPVAIDAVSAKLMGIDPLRVRYIRHAQERGLGIGDPKQIQILGDSEIFQENWHFDHDQDNLASWGEKQIEGSTRPEPNQPRQRRSRAPWTRAASNLYHNLYWYPFVGARRAEMMLNTAWGQKFLQYSEGLPFNPGADSKMPAATVAAASVAAFGLLGLGVYYAAHRQRNSRS